MPNVKNNILMRSLLFVPGHDSKLLMSAAKSTADVLILDVEDSVLPESNKAIARVLIKQFVNSKQFEKFRIFVRLNERLSGHMLKDLTELAIDGVDGFLFSKTGNRDDIVFLDRLLESIEVEKGFPSGKFQIIPILETASSVINADAIAKASSRILTIGFGSEDFISDMSGIRDFEDGESIFFARSLVAVVARANGMSPIDAAYIHVHDLPGLEKHLAKGKLLGFSGMWVLHPKQIEYVNKCYSPSQADVENANEILRIYEVAKKNGKGVAIIDGKFVGPPLVEAAKKTLQHHEKVSKKA